MDKRRHFIKEDTQSLSIGRKKAMTTASFSKEITTPTSVGYTSHLGCRAAWLPLKAKQICLLTQQLPRGEEKNWKWASKQLWVNNSKRHYSREPQVEIPQMSIKTWMKKQDVASTLAGKLLDHRNEWSTNYASTWTHTENILLTERSQEEKGHILYASIYIKYPE